MFYERLFHGPFSEKIEKATESIRDGRLLRAYGHRVIDLIDDFARETLPESIYNSITKEMGILSCAREDVMEGRYDWALDDISTIEYCLNKVAPEKLKEVGNWCFKMYLVPVDDDYSGEIVISPDGNKYARYMFVLEPALKEDTLEILPEGFNKMV